MTWRVTATPILKHVPCGLKCRLDSDIDGRVVFKQTVKKLKTRQDRFGGPVFLSKFKKDSWKWHKNDWNYFRKCDNIKNNGFKCIFPVVRCWSWYLTALLGVEQVHTGSMFSALLLFSCISYRRNENEEIFSVCDGCFSGCAHAGSIFWNGRSSKSLLSIDGGAPRPYRVRSYINRESGEKAMTALCGMLSLLFKRVSSSGRQRSMTCRR